MRIYLGADHNGFEMKRRVAEFLRRTGHEVVDEGDKVLNPEDDFPQFAGRVVSGLLADKDNNQARGILICSSGQGMCMAANRFKGIRASLCWNLAEARAARNDDDSNVLCISARYSSYEDIEGIITTWLNTPFAGAARFKRRIAELDRLG